MLIVHGEFLPSRGGEGKGRGGEGRGGEGRGGEGGGEGRGGLFPVFSLSGGP